LSGQTGRKLTRTRQEHPQGFLQTVPKQEGNFYFSAAPDPNQIDLTQNSCGASTMRSLTWPLKYRASWTG